MNQCKFCLKSYVLPHDLQRHLKLKHPMKEKGHTTSPNLQQESTMSIQQQQQKLYITSNKQQQEGAYSTQQRIYETSQYQNQEKHLKQQQQQKFQFTHPFTANVSGPTSCGKTYFVKLLLQNCLTKIDPPPERIIWLYKRWQLLYDVIKDTVSPSVEFIRGIPMDLEEDSFLNPQTRNLLILDDMMSTASKDTRINELFTEGSHHRNLSVIAINQNLFYNKDPTQRRNCHYLVLFKNPIDKQQVMTLARQMYPDNSQHLMRHFTEATEKPFQYLLIDLKPTTPESMRMRTDIFSDMPIKEHKPEAASHLQVYSEEERTHLNSCCEVKSPTFAIMDSSSGSAMSSCDDCGLVFDSTHDLQRHIKRWCPENDKRKRQLSVDYYEEPPKKKSSIYFSQMNTKWTMKMILLVRQQKRTTSKE